MGDTAPKPGTWHGFAPKPAENQAARDRSKPKSYQCSFCGRQLTEVERLIAGPNGVYICNECVDLCKNILEEERRGGRRPVI